MPTRSRTSNAKTHKRVILTIECFIPKGVRVAELEIRSNWDTLRVRTNKYDYIIPDVIEMIARYKGVGNVVQPEAIK